MNQDKCVSKEDFLSLKMIEKLLMSKRTSFEMSTEFPLTLWTTTEDKPQISKEHFIWTFALIYRGNTEDKMSYIMSMYAATYGQSETKARISAADYTALIHYGSRFRSCPRLLRDAIDEKEYLYHSEYIEYVRKHIELMQFFRTALPPTHVKTPDVLRVDNTTRDHLNGGSPSHRGSARNRSGGSVDVVAIDSSDEDSEDDSEDELLRQTNEDQKTQSTTSAPEAQSNSTSKGYNQEPIVSQDLTCGYLHKLSDGRWSRSRWHQRWFVLDKVNRVLHYYKYNPAEKNAYPTSPAGMTQRIIDQKHPWYRGSIDLKHPKANLLLEKSLAKNAPTQHIFQVAYMNIGDIDQRHVKSFKLCADTNDIFTTWGTQISELTAENFRERRLSEKLETGIKKETKDEPVAVSTQPFISDESILAFTGQTQCTAVFVVCNAFVMWLCLAEHRLVWPTSLYDCCKLIISMCLTTSFLSCFLSLKRPDQVDHHRLIEPTTGTSAVTRSAVANKFQLGCSTKKCMNDIDSDVINSWKPTEANHFSVRASDYVTTQAKIRSSEALLEFLGIDVIRTDRKLSRISDHIILPNGYENHRFIVLNAQIPSYPPANILSRKPITNGPGYSLVLYWAIPPDVLESLDPSANVPVLRLLNDFLNNPTQEIEDRFKVIAQVANPESCGVRAFGKRILAGYNGTPVLTRPQHEFTRSKDGRVLEIAVDVHRFCYFARSAIYALLGITTNMVIDVAVLLQATEDHELPEQVLGCGRCIRIDLSKAKHINDL